MIILLTSKCQCRFVEGIVHGHMVVRTSGLFLWIVCSCAVVFNIETVQEYVGQIMCLNHFHGNHSLAFVIGLYLLWRTC